MNSELKVVLHKRFWSIYGHSKSKCMSFDLSKEEFFSWFKTQPFECRYCKRKFDLSNGQKPRGLVIDRWDNDLGYLLNNMVLCCKQCNSKKTSRLNGEEMVTLMQKLRENGAMRYFDP